ncbi:MAG: hypothetical protein SFY66_28925 [Oculatellaceae cyanobacterium bins.114]|nr:hypothetical protein [Oculatellaceae cyanobacterium bins.114]
MSFQVISGAFGSRPSDDRNQIWVGETVRFTLSPDPSLPNSYAMLQDARRTRNWARLPQMTVTGTRSVVVTANARDPLQIEYTFRWEGQKQLHFTGTPGEIVLPTATRARRVSATTLFPPLDYELDLRVVPPPERGRDAASMAGAASREYQRGEREREQEQDRYRGLERERQQAEQRDRAARRDVAEEERSEILSGARGSRRRALRNGLLNVRLRTETELLRMSISQVEDYLRDLQAAINVTPPLDLANYGWRSQGSELQYADAWETERLQDGRIKFYQVRRFRATRPAATARGFEIRSVPESYRHNEIIFPGNAWIVAQVTGRSEKALFPVADLSSQLEAEQWARLFGSLVSLAFFVAEAAVAPEAAVFELLLEMVLPPEVLLAVAGVSIVRGLVSGLRLVITRGLRGSARSAVRSLTSTVDDAVGQGRRTITSPRSPSPSATGGTGSRAAGEILDEGGDIARRGERGTEAATRPDSEARGTTSASRGTLSVPDTDDIDIILDRSFEATFGGQLVDMNATPYRPPSAPFSVSARARQIFRAARERFRSLQPGYASQLGVGRGGQVHHAIELQVIQRYGSVFIERELNSFVNMRGIPPERTASGIMDAVRGRRQLHNSYIRQQWDRQYAILDQRIRELGLRRGSPEYRQFVRQSLEEGRREIDNSVGQFFSEVRMGETWTRRMLPQDMASLPDADGVVRRAISQ